MRKKWAVFFKNLRKMFNGEVLTNRGDFGVMAMPANPNATPHFLSGFTIASSPPECGGAAGFTVTTSPKMPPSIGGADSTETK